MMMMLLMLMMCLGVGHGVSTNHLAFVESISVLSLHAPQTLSHCLMNLGLLLMRMS